MCSGRRSPGDSLRGYARYEPMRGYTIGEPARGCTRGVGVDAVLHVHDSRQSSGGAQGRGADERSAGVEMWLTAGDRIRLGSTWIGLKM
jgi:hypothetical protein